MARKLVVALAVALAGCGEEELPPGEAVITLGQESDAWAGSEVALVETEDDSGKRSEILRTSAPISRFELGKGGVTTFVVSGLDAGDVARVRGRSLPVNPAGFAGIELPLFVSRASELARPPGNLQNPQTDSPPLELVMGRYLFAFGGTDADRARVDAYDFGSWQPFGYQSMSCPTPPCRVESFAVVDGSLGLALGGDWGLEVDFLDLANPIATDAPLPEGLGSYGDVVGGATIHAEDGSAYLIGGTRSGTPTAAVVRIHPDGKLEYSQLAAPRAGAAATWVTGRGLVVVGGGDDVAAGAELLAKDASSFVPLPFPADQTTGATIVSIDGSSVVRLGGRNAAGMPAESVALNLGCGTACAPEPAGAALDLVSARGFLLPSDRVLVVGTSSNGETLAFSWSEAEAISVALREPRKGASATAVPTGHVAIVGGAHLDGSPALSVELFIE
jgi:hypothetical protein